MTFLFLDDRWREGIPTSSRESERRLMFRRAGHILCKTKFTLAFYSNHMWGGYSSIVRSLDEKKSRVTLTAHDVVHKNKLAVQQPRTLKYT